jgi:RES domain-containing protein
MNDTSGMGAFKWGGRWNAPGLACMYTSEHISLALLEKLVHVQQIKDMKDIALMTFEILQPEKLYRIDNQKLRKNWQLDFKYSQWLGSQILEHQDLIGFKAPSIIVPTEWNIILQPNLTEKEGLRLIDTTMFKFDNRLKRIAQ